MKSVISLLLKKVALGLLGVAILVSVVSAENAEVVQTGRDKLALLDQPFLFFKTVGKYPTMLKCDEAIGTLDTVMCGVLDPETNQVKAPKRGKDFETLIPMRSITKFIDCGIKADKKYEGYRSTVMSKALEQSFAFLGLMDLDGYKGTILVDEYLEGMPSKWVVRNNEDVTGIIRYLRGQFDQLNIKPTCRPILVIECKNPGYELAPEDQAFLDMYFECASRNDQDVKEFFQNAQDRLYEVSALTAEYKNDMETWGESVLRLLEKDNNDLKGKDITAATVKYVVGLTVASVGVAFFKDPLEKYFRGVYKSINDKFSSEPAA